MHLFDWREPLTVVSGTPTASWATIDVSSLVGPGVVGVVLAVRYDGLSYTTENVRRGWIGLSADNTSQGFYLAQQDAVGPSRTSAFKNMLVVWVPLTAAKTFDYRSGPSGAGALQIDVVGHVHSIQSGGLLSSFDLVPIPNGSGAFVASSPVADWVTVSPANAPADAFGFIGRAGMYWGNGDDNNGEAFTGAITLSIRPDDSWNDSIQMYQLGTNVEYLARLSGGLLPIHNGSFQYKMPNPGGGSNRNLTTHIGGSYWLVSAGGLSAGYNMNNFEPTNATLVSGGTATSFTKIAASAGRPGDIAVLILQSYENNTLNTTGEYSFSCHVRECITADHNPQSLWTITNIGQINTATTQKDVAFVRLDNNLEFEYRMAGQLTNVSIYQVGVIRKNEV